MTSKRLRSAQAAGKVSLAVAISRVLGLAREMTFAKIFGAGLANDAFVVAFLVPNLFRDLFAEGALSSAFVPAFTDYLRNKGRQQAFLLGNLVLSALMVILGAFALGLFLFSDQSVYLVAFGYLDDPLKSELTSSLIQILSPFLLFVAMASVAMGMLNALGHFFLPALAPAIFNLVLVISGFTLVPMFERQGIQPILAMGFGALLGGMLQFAVQIPLLRRHGFRFRPRFDWGHPGIRRMLRLIGPAVVGLSAVQINVVVTTQMAAFLPPDDGPVSWLKYAFRVLYLPVGMVGVAVGIVNLRNVSVSAAAQEWDGLKETVANSLKLVSLMALPAAAGLLVLAEPVVRALFERDQFGPMATHYTSLALMCYSLALWAYSCQKIYVPTFYALNDTRTPVRISLASVSANIAFNLVVVFGLLNQFAPRYAYLGLALGTAFAVLLQNVLLQAAFRSRMGSLASFGVGPALAKMASAALMMGGVVYLLRSFMSFYEGEFWSQAALLVFYVSAGTGTYFALCHLLGVEEIRTVFERVRRRGGEE